MSQCWGWRTITDGSEPSYAFKLDGSAMEVQCPVGQGCCRTGDACLSNGICQYTDWMPEGSTGFYMAGCVDSTFNSPDCPRQCTSLGQPGIVYNYATSEWACCGAEADGETFACDNPSTITFSAPAPNLLTNYSLAGGSSTSAPNSAPTESIGSEASSNSNASSGLSTGAKAGIGAGAGVGALLLIVMIIWCFISHRNRRRYRDSRINEVSSRTPNGAGPGAASNHVAPATPAMTTMKANNKYHDTESAPCEVPAVSAQKQEYHTREESLPDYRYSDVEVYPPSGLEVVSGPGRSARHHDPVELSANQPWRM